jgi:glutamate 5-kinase
MARVRERWVVKAGSQLVCEGGPILVRAWMSQVAELRKKHGVEVIWVTSGAIASAVERTGARKGVRRRARSLPEKQALSAIGQPLVMDLYNLALQSQGLLGAQILLTYDDLAAATRRRNFQNTVEQLLKWNVTPILNENDAVATEEIRFGDNDSLSARVARVMGADRLVILTDVDGLYDSDPRENARARLLTEIPAISTALLKKVARARGSAHGTGGMLSKLQAAREAARASIPTRLARGDALSVLTRIARGERVGTQIG